MRLLKRSVSILLTLTMMLGILAVIPIEASAAGGISYVYRYWDSANKKVVDTVKACNDYTALDSRSDDYLKGWYVVDHNMTINSRLYVDDDDPVNIILCDGATLTCPKGIQISYYSRLNIYGQSRDSGKLVIHPESSSESPGNSHALIEANGVFNFYGGTLEAKCGAGLTHFDGAAIGGAKGKTPGTVSFYGGKVHARTYFNGAAIGGGYQGGTGTVRFYGGEVYAEGTSSPGIGNGPEGNSDGSIEIYEGTVDSVTHNFSAGIGGADGTDGPAITISGGNVYGCNTHDTKGGAGIGSGYNANRTKPIRISGGLVQGRGWSGAGIGSGALADVSRIDITGGVIIGESEKGGAGIGGGYKGDAGTISISNACVNASSKSFKDADEYAEVMNAWINRINMNSITSKDAGIAAGAMYLLLTGVRELGLAFADSEGGCAVGGGYNGSFDTINISNCPSFVANGAKYCAAIGSGDEAKHCGTINITDSTVEAYAGSDAAAIGTGNEAEETAIINITGSTITAHGGRFAAGIGGGDDVSGGIINITNSTIKEAKSETDGAGIGGGEDGHGGNITIKNSNVTAHGGGYGAGIGGGDEGDGGIIKIDHSTVKAYGGTDAAGIGGGENGDGGKIYITNGSNVYARGLVCGAGIGGGEDSSGEYCHIGIGCTVEAQAGGYLNAQAIGHGECGWYVDSYTGGTLSLEQSGVVFAGNKRYYGKDRYEAIWRSNYVLISPCNHKVSTDYRYDTPGYHVKYCTLCGTRIGDTQEAHVWDSHNECTKCHASATMLDVYFITRDKNNKEITETKKIPHQSMYILPECENIPDGYDFLYWEVGSSPYFLPGEEVRIHGGDTKIRAVYLPVVETEYVDAYGNLNKIKARKIDTPKNLNLKAASLMLPEGWYVVDSDITFAHQNIIFTKNVNLIIADGKTLKFDQYENKRWEEIEYCSIYPAKSFSDAGDFTIYGQSKQTGTVDIGYRYAFIPNLVINGGIFKCEPVKSRKSTSTTYTLTINRGQLKGYCFSCEKGTGWVDEDLFTMTGGNIELSELAVRGNLKLGWSSLTDSIKINDYSRGNIRIADGQSLKDENGNIYSGALSGSQVNAIKGKTLTPYLEHSYNAPEWKWDNEYCDATAVFRCKDCADVQEIKAKATHEDSGNNRKVTARCTFLGQEYQTTQTFRIIFDVTVAKTQNGKVTANRTTAKTEDNIRLDIAPDEGYILSELYYTDSKGKKTAIEGSSFTMPEGSVTVMAVFEAGAPEHTHTYGEPVWDWDEDYIGATVTRTCTHPNCKHTESVLAEFVEATDEDGIPYTEAVAKFSDAVYHDVQPAYKTEAGGYIVEVTRRFKGGVDSGKHNMVGSDGFRVVFKNKDGNKVNAPQYIWVAQESASDGVVVDPNGDVSFTKEGDFHVQLRSPDGNTVYSPWITVRAYRGGDDGLDEGTDDPADDTPSPVIHPENDMPQTGDTSSAAVVAAILLTSLTAALFLAMKRRKGEDET
ncbi:MAG: LPXTG cell wall anchor domain-containing protein [Acutalibacteraceae bacterium]|nr:LPXTG cell wall anchor domain-containing protein [Acutalibacteraceae bacterium]